MKCLRCQNETPVGAQFCGQCGARLEVLCFACQTPNPPADRFCHRCGQPLATAAGPVSAPTAVVTHDDPSVARSGGGAERRGSTVWQRLEGDEMPDQDREPDDVGSPGSRAKPKRLCIVSRDRLVTGEFLQALQMSLDPDDELEIIPDRRRPKPSVEAKPGAADQPSIERRHHLYVDLALRNKGYSIVPAPVANPLRIADRLAPDVPRSPIERLSLGDADEDNRELERILRFKRRQEVRGSWLIAMLLVGVMLVLLSQLPAVKTFISRTRAGAPPSPTRQPSLEPVPPVAENPSPISQAPEVPQAEGPERPEAVRPRQSREAARPRDASTQPQPAPDPVATMPPPAAERRDVVSPRFAGLPRVELVRNPAAASEGQGEAYAARISDAAGQPLAGAEVSLVVSMADGTVLDIPLDPGPELGTYLGTAPPGRSALVDLRIRVLTSDKRVEIPLGP
jgi:hypothetical protein